MAATLVGIFDDFAEAQTAVRQLTAAGVKQGAISIARNDGGQGYETYGGANSSDYSTGTSTGGGITGFFESLFGTDDDNTKNDRDVYSESVRRGSTVVTVQTDEQMTDRAADILNSAGAVDVDRRAAQYRAGGYEKHDASAPLYTAEQATSERANYNANQGEIALPVIEEQLAVGKRVVQRGGVRIHSRVSERPVEESINLREENITVDRHAVDRAVTDADMTALGETDFTVTKRAEVPVVAKEARIVEEVVVGKNTTERSETVTDTVKRTDVEVEETDADGMNQSRKANS